MNVVDYFTLLAGLLGTAAFIWRVSDVVRSYLHIEVKAEVQPDGAVTAIASVENNRLPAKNLDYAFLLIGPEDDGPIGTAKKIAESQGLQVDLRHTNDIGSMGIKKAVYIDGGRALIPLRFFYAEQARIADERVTYRTKLDTSKMTPGRAYSVRFFVYGPERLHRCTQDLLVMPQRVGEGAQPN